MNSVFVKKLAASAILVFLDRTCLASEHHPSILQEPLLGLRYETASTKFEPFPKSALAKCDAASDDKRGTSYWFIYAKFEDVTGRVYYVGGNYFTWNNISPDQGKFQMDDRGAVFVFQDNNCVYLEEARDVFHKRGRLGAFIEEVPQYVLQRLASDYALRLERAFGGAGRLRVELRNQRVDPDDLAVELHEALKPYLPPTPALR